MSSYTKLRLSIFFLFTLMVLMAWDNYHRYVEYKMALNYHIDSSLSNAVMLSDALLGKDFHNDLKHKNSISPSQEKTNELLLNTIADKTQMKYIYSIINDRGTIRIASSSNLKEDYKKGLVSRYFDPYPEISAVAKAVLTTQIPRYYSYTDRWGSFRSIFFPMKSTNGTPYIIVADIDVSHIDAMLNHAIMDFIEIPFAILLLICGLGLYYIRLSAKANDQLQNSNDQLDLMRHSLEAKIAKKTLDLEVKNHQLEKLNAILENRVGEEIEKNIEKDHQLIHQSRLAQLGEMVSMIAHQWRQPLAAIGANVLDVKLKFSLEKFDLTTIERQNQCKNYIETSLHEIEENVQMLTSTIDDFRNFYKADKAVKSLLVQNPIEQAIKVMQSSFESNNILLTQDYRATRTVQMYDSELTQVFLNILKNAQDNFLERKTDNPVVMISTYHTPNNGIGITFCDNGGGIDDAIIDKIFDPYFTTKSEFNGSGLGLYMSKTIIEEHHIGLLSVSKIPRGVCFKIELEGIRS